MQEIKKDLYLIDKAELLQVIMEKKNALWRLCQICCSFPKAENHYEVTYSFANGYDFANYRLIVENIKLDLHDKLYRIDVETPFIEKEDK